MKRKLLLVSDDMQQELNAVAVYLQASVGIAHPSLPDQVMAALKQARQWREAQTPGELPGQTFIPGAEPVVKRKKGIH